MSNTASQIDRRTVKNGDSSRFPASPYPTPTFPAGGDSGAFYAVETSDQMIARLVAYLRERAPMDADSMILTLLVRAIASLEVALTMRNRP